MIEFLVDNIYSVLGKSGARNIKHAKNLRRVMSWTWRESNDLNKSYLSIWSTITKSKLSLSKAKMVMLKSKNELFISFI